MLLNKAFKTNYQHQTEFFFFFLKKEEPDCGEWVKRREIDLWGENWYWRRNPRTSVFFQAVSAILLIAVSSLPLIPFLFELLSLSLLLLFSVIYEEKWMIESGPCDCYIINFTGRVLFRDRGETPPLCPLGCRSFTRSFYGHQLNSATWSNISRSLRPKKENWTAVMGYYVGPCFLFDQGAFTFFGNPFCKYYSILTQNGEHQWSFNYNQWQKQAGFWINERGPRLLTWFFTRSNKSISVACKERASYMLDLSINHKTKCNPSIL